MFRYKQRLQTVRAELTVIQAEVEALPADEIEASKPLQTVAQSLIRLCKILVRVIDSLPG